MTSLPNNKILPNFKDPLFWAFFIPFIYWIYLFFTSQMVITNDAFGYEGLGRLLYEKGWVEYFSSGPNREPIYPLTVTFSMWLGDFLKVPYQAVQKIFQIIIFFITLNLTLRALKHIGISDKISAGVILYLGISPAMVNSAFSLYSEIITYPLVLGIVLASLKCWDAVKKQPVGQTVLWSLYFSFLFIAIGMVKAIFIYILYLYAAPFVCLMSEAFFKKDKTLSRNLAVFLVIVLSVVSLYAHFYKTLNFRFNGFYALSDRGNYIFYGNAVKRTDDLTSNRFWAGLASIPGEGVCKRLFSEEDCYHWSIFNQDKIGMTKIGDLNKSGIPGREVDRTLLYLSKQAISGRPLQFLFFTAMESIKMFFWESTQVGFVAYPDWLGRLFSITVFKNLLRLGAALVTMFAFFYCFIYLWRGQSKAFIAEGEEGEKLRSFFFVILLILITTAFYSFSTIHTRYVFPVVPLFLICIAHTLQRLAERR